MKPILSTFAFLVCVTLRASLPAFADLEFYDAQQTSGGGGGGYTLLFHASAGGTTDGATNTVNATGATLLTVEVHSFGSFVAPTDNTGGGNTYTKILGTNGGGYFLAIYTCVNPTVTSSMKIYAAGANTYDVIQVQGWTGNNASPTDLAMGNFIPGNSLQSGAITPSQNNSLVLSAYTISVNETISVDSPFAPVLDQSQCGGGGALQGAVATNIQTTATSANPTWTVSTGGDQLAVTISLKP